MTLNEYVSHERGLQRQIALTLGISPVLISQWSSGSRQVPAERCLAIEKATSGKVTRYDLRPDIFGSAPSEEAAHVA
jgi:DNA-binding transcriptional regulator YdaS (Cro superfamily)